MWGHAMMTYEVMLRYFAVLSAAGVALLVPAVALFFR
jgi:hypothetical protein